jgi:hypothetical protein
MNQIETRLMIDFKTYRKMHPGASLFHEKRIRTKDELPKGAMEKNAPPDSQFPLLLPAKIYGFNLQNKQWSLCNSYRDNLFRLICLIVEVSVELISDVQWNKESFDRLVMDPKKKELARALVTIHNTTDQSADLLAGKGNGLVILLHGFVF